MRGSQLPTICSRIPFNLDYFPLWHASTLPPYFVTILNGSHVQSRHGCLFVGVKLLIRLIKIYATSMSQFRYVRLIDNLPCG
jgi:hypothetical protein